ncbi:type II toxin-antitoxin system PemK/MazF family toxin [Candidatus Woesearchaeota archaeon]|nr:type II toxin-antitoxin system PemK/MazF family toxin [Candidatus Woesearchaeota archaeon]
MPNTIEVKPSNGNGLSAISVALIFQVRAIDKKRLKTMIGKLEKQLIEKLDAMLKRLLSL